MVGFYPLEFHVADLRSADYFLMNPPWFPFVLVAGYLYFVLDFGPKFMATRRPFDLKKLILVYNVIQVLINLVLFVLVCFAEVLQDRCLCSFSFAGFPAVVQDSSIADVPTRQLLHRSRRNVRTEPGVQLLPAEGVRPRRYRTYHNLLTTLFTHETPTPP